MISHVEPLVELLARHGDALGEAVHHDLLQVLHLDQTRRHLSRDENFESGYRAVSLEARRVRSKTHKVRSFAISEHPPTSESARKKAARAREDERFAKLATRPKSERLTHRYRLKI